MCDYTHVYIYIHNSAGCLGVLGFLGASCVQKHRYLLHFSYFSSKVPFGRASEPPERPKVPLGRASEPPERSKMPLGHTSELSERSKV